MQRFFTLAITFFSGIRSIVLIVFGIVFLVCAGVVLYDAATFSYGDDFARHHQETWTPPDTPRYSRHPDPVISESEQSALAKGICDKAAAEGLRVSPGYPWMAWRSEAVAREEWKANFVMIVVCGLGAVILVALGVSLWPGREAAVKSASRKKRLQAARKRVKG